MWTGDSRRRRRRSWSPADSGASRQPRRWCAAATSDANRHSRRNCRRRGDGATRAPRSATAPSPQWPSKRRPLSTTPARRQVTAYPFEILRWKKIRTPDQAASRRRSLSKAANWINSQACGWPKGIDFSPFFRWEGCCVCTSTRSRKPTHKRAIYFSCFLSWPFEFFFSPFTSWNTFVVCWLIFCLGRILGNVAVCVSFDGLLDQKRLLLKCRNRRMEKYTSRSDQSRFSIRLSSISNGIDDNEPATRAVCIDIYLLCVYPFKKGAAKSKVVRRTHAILHKQNKSRRPDQSLTGLRFFFFQCNQYNEFSLPFFSCFLLW